MCFILIVFLLSAIFVKDAHAYLDPGAGSYFFQILIAAIVGGLFAIKLSWKKIVGFIKGLFSKQARNG